MKQNGDELSGRKVLARLESGEVVERSQLEELKKSYYLHFEVPHASNHEPHPLNCLSLIREFIWLGVPVPEDLGKWFDDRVQRYFDHEGEMSLDRCLGLIGREGQRNAFTKSKEARTDLLVAYLHTLKMVTGFSMASCARLVANRDQHWGWGETSEETLKRAYRKAKDTLGGGDDSPGGELKFLSTFALEPYQFGRLLEKDLQKLDQFIASKKAD